MHGKIEIECTLLIIRWYAAALNSHGLNSKNTQDWESIHLTSASCKQNVKLLRAHQIESCSMVPLLIELWQDICRA